MSEAPAKRKYNRVIKNCPRHGLVGTPTYAAWVNMCARCEAVNNPQYKNYGGRGITVCDRWRGSFLAFREDMGDRPEDMSIDRIDNDKGYEPGNCRWATRRQQSRNTRLTLRLTHEGETLPLIEWCERLDIPLWPARRKFKAGLHPSLVLDPRYRIRRQSRKLRKNGRVYEFRGRAQSLSEWSRELGIVRETLRIRLWRGWTVEAAFTTPADHDIYSTDRWIAGLRAGQRNRAIKHVVDGEELTLPEIESRHGTRYKTLLRRHKQGLAGEELIYGKSRPDKPPKSSRGRGRPPRVIEFAGQTRTLTEWADALGILPCSLRTRLKSQPLEIALGKPRYVHTSKVEANVATYSLVEGT